MEPLVDRTRKTLDSEKPRTTKTQNICLVPAVSGEVILWNPAIQEFKHLPSQPYLPDSPEIAVRPVGWPEGLPFLQYRHCEYMDALGFGHDPRCNDYKVVNIEFLGVESPPDGYDINLPPKTAVYTLSTNSWREIKTFSLETQSTILYPETFQMYFKGMCFWSGQERHKDIHVYDVMDEEFIRNIIILFDMGDESDEILMADTKDTNGRIFSYNLSTKKLEYHPIQSVQIDSEAVVYGNYSIVSLLVGNKLENTDNAGFSLFDYSSFPSSHSMVDNEWHSYSVWAMPPDDVSLRIKKVMESLRLEFGGPEIEPHIPVVGSLRMTHEEVLNKFRSLQSCVTSGYKAKVNQVVIRSFYYQCVSLLIDSSFDHSDESFELWRATRACGKCFGFCIGARPHLSLLYGNLTEEEKKKAQEKVSILDESITSMSFPITRLALYKIDYKDKSLKSWDKIAEHTLQYFI
ncbi:hypothetical protein M0R45_028562 [Rubus argutus]|uniref:Uncharacterized protein n=1 Tax=Rubus argutus TaxID=59490 RepID=A0AAW1W860_RUBAR